MQPLASHLAQASAEQPEWLWYGQRISCVPRFKDWLNSPLMAMRVSAFIQAHWMAAMETADGNARCRSSLVS